MREIWLSNTAGRIPTVNQLEIADAQIGYNRVDAKLYGLRVIDGVKTVVLLGQSTAANHDRLHSMISAADHAATTPGCYPVTGPDGNWELAPIPTPGGGVDTSTRLIDGSVLWLELLSFLVTDTQYKIWGQLYTTIAIEVELDASDPDNDRIDMICVNTSQEVVILKGVAAENPAAPIPDPYTQLELTTILVKAGATAPEITTVQVYDENIEWTTSSLISGPETTSCDFESTVDPVVNSKCILITKTGDDGIKKLELYFAGPDTVLGEDAKLGFRLKSSTAWLDSSAIEIVLKLNGAQVGNSVLLVGNNFGNNSTMPAWNTIVIPAANFGATGLTIDEIEMRFSYTYWFANGGTIALDDMKLQFGASVTPPVVVGSEIIIPQLRMDVGGYRETGDPYPMLGTLKASWQAFNTEFLKYNPEIWVFRRKSYTRRLMLSESWTNYVINALFAAPVLDWQANGDNVAFANDRVEFTNADAGESISFIPTGAFLKGKIFRIIVNCTSYTLGGWHFKFGTYESMDYGVGNFVLEVQFHESQDASQFSIISSFDNTTLHIDNVYVIERERTYAIKQHKKWTHEPHLNGVKFEGSNFWSGSTQSPVDEIADTGRHTEFTCPLVSEQKLKIEIDPFEYYFGYTDDGVRHKIDENSTWSDFNAIVTSGRRGSLNIPFRFAIVIDNPDTEGKDPKMIGPLSDIIHMHVRAPNQYGNVYSFTQYYKFTVATRKY